MNLNAKEWSGAGDRPDAGSDTKSHSFSGTTVHQNTLCCIIIHFGTTKYAIARHNKLQLQCIMLGIEES